MKIALYADDGVSASTINHWLLMAKEGLIDEFEIVKAKDITTHNLTLFDWLIFPGGSGSRICSRLTKQNREDLEKTIRQGYINVMGICAGAYALSSGYDWSLGFIDYEVVDKSNWARGKTNVSVDFTKHGKKKLEIKKDTTSVYYNNGPVLLESSHPENKSKVIATYVDDICKEGGTEGLMAGSPAIIASKLGRGNIITISPHFEKTPKANKIISKLLKIYLHN